METRIRLLTPVQTLIERLGVSYLAEFFGHKNVSTISSWKARSSIPVAHWLMVIEAAKTKGLTDVDLQVLAKISTGEGLGVQFSCSCDEVDPSATVPEPAP